jgi:hypothetical protein
MCVVCAVVNKFHSLRSDTRRLATHEAMDGGAKRFPIKTHSESRRRFCVDYSIRALSGVEDFLERFEKFREITAETAVRYIDSVSASKSF